MSEINTGQRGTGARETTASRPAVGLVATGEDGDAIAGAILRAFEAGHEPLVAASDPRVEGARFAEQLDVRVVYVDELANGTEPDVWGELAEVARSGGYPGLLRHPEPGTRLDFEASREAMADVSDYVVEPALDARVGEAPDVLAAIPAYNESGAIEGVVIEARSVADEVLVVDDGSTDDTVELSREAGATVIEHADNRGYGGALKTAFREADRAGAETLVILDGDGQHDPADVPELVELQRDSGAEIVIGSRFENGSETELPLYRTVGLRVVNVLTNLSLGVVRSESRISDTQSGFRAYSREAVSSLAGDGEIGDNMGASTDILYHAHREGYDVAEVGTTIDYDVDAASSQNPVSHGLQLVQNILRTVERERPVTVLGIPGFVSAVIGLGFGYATFSNFLASGVFPLGLALVSVFFTLAGIFAAFTAIILHSLETHAR